MNENILQLVKLGVDQINKVPMTDFSAQDRNEVMRAKFLELMGTDKFDIMAYNQHKYEIFQIIRETLQQTVANGQPIEDAFYMQFVEERNVEWGDRVDFEIENDALLTVGQVSGNNWDLDRQRIDKGAIITPKMKAYYIKAYDYFKRFMTGRADYTELVAVVDKSIARFKIDFCAKVFASAVDGLPANFKHSGAFNADAIQGVLNHVSAACDGEVILVGTKGALNKLQDITDLNKVKLTDNMADEINSVGFLRRWKGYNCVELPTKFKANSIENFIFDTNKIYVLSAGEKPVKIVNEGSMIVDETADIQDKNDMTKEMTILWNMGGVAIFNKFFGVIELT